MFKKHILIACFASTFLTLAMPAQAMPTSEVTFEIGSDCGSFKGDLTGGRLFTLELGANQELKISSDGHVQSVTDNTGEILIDQGGHAYRYVTKRQGTHTIKMVGRTLSEVEFCVL